MTQKICDHIRIVLVEPAGALNVGSVARVMKNFGLKQLILVNPKCDHLDDPARMMAVKAVDILESAQVVETMAAGLAGCQRVIATTARSRSLPTALQTPRQAFPWLMEQPVMGAILFGNEESGLSNEQLNYAQRFVSIQTSPDYPSLNLAQAVGVCVYELSQLVPSLPTDTPRPDSSIAPTEILEGYYQHLEQTLLTVEFLYPHTAKARMEKFRRLFGRAELTTEEVALLRGILGSVNRQREQK
ncbi:MAG: RNA methyltransferase [Cyanobacteria bacterium P01_H01_bin.15]